MLDAINEEIPVEQMFVNDLKRSIELNDKKDARPGSASYKPSGMSCIRMSYYVLTGADGDDWESNSISVGICESGSDRHERIQRAVLRMKENGMDCEYINVADFVRQREIDYLDIVKEPNFEAGEFETKLYWKDLRMSFLCDGIIKYHNHYYILEIKTETSGKFFQRKEVDPSHYNQATAYSLAFGIDEVLFLYECRDNCDKKCFMFTVTDRMRKDLIKYIKTCDKYIEKGEVPPIPENISKKACSYCGYKTRCKGDM
jgi:CRISPR/Cas system-associated exonuclease Cas4 (RecB family)